MDFSKGRRMAEQKIDPTPDQKQMTPADERLQDFAQAAAVPTGGALMHRQRDQSMAQAFTGLMPSSIGEALQLAQTLARAGKAVPAIYQGNPEGAFMVILAGLELGLTPIRAMQSLVPISGSLAMKADLQLALVRRSGALDFYDEGFELAGDTDRDESLERRIAPAGHQAQAELARAAQLIIDLTEGVPEGKPYGWAISKRKGDPQYHVRVFTFLDADRFKYNDWEDVPGQRDRQKVEKTLAQKAAYVNNPQDMYPKRARVRVLAVTHSDVLAGMPAIEAMDEVVVEGQVVDQGQAPAPISTEDTIQQMLDAIKAKDAQAAATIVSAFEQLQMGIPKRLLALRKFEGKPQELVEHLKDEYANQRNGGKGRVAKPAAPAVDLGVNAAPASEPASTMAGALIQAGHLIAAEDKRREEAAAEQPKTSVGKVAERFKAARRSI